MKYSELTPIQRDYFLKEMFMQYETEGLLDMFISYNEDQYQKHNYDIDEDLESFRIDLSEAPSN